MILLDGLNSLGIETWLLVGQKRTDHPRVIPFHLSPFFDYRVYEARDVGRSDRRRRLEQWFGLEDFNYPYSHHLLELTGPPPDVVICHNLHGGFFDLRALPELCRRVPVILRLFDTWLFAGHCAYSNGCRRWETGCGRCPDLKIPPAIQRDATRINWWRKQRVFRSSSLIASAESQWMIERAKQSILAPAVSKWSHVAGGVDLAVFSPGSVHEARQKLKLADDINVLLYVANFGAYSPFKDFETVRNALREIGRRAPQQKIELLVVGSAAPDERITPDILVRHIGRVQSQHELAAFYRAADLYVHSTFEETFGNSVAEALACGRPVVTASQGGVVELMEHERTGMVVPPRSPVELAQALLAVLDKPALAKTMGASAAISARGRLDSRDTVHGMFELAQQAHAEWHHRRSTDSGLWSA